MGKIHFKDDVKVATWKAIEEAHDCADVATDLLRIQNTIVYGTDEEAMRLDLELWKKYPVINAGNVDAVLKEEIGIVFKKVLEDAGVFKRDAKGQAAFDRFTATL